MNWTRRPGGIAPDDDDRARRSSFERKPISWRALGLAGASLLAVAIATGVALRAADERERGARAVPQRRPALGFTVRNLASQPLPASQPLVDPDDVVSGGPPPDGIPPIDDPRYERVSDVDWLAAREPVIALTIGDDARAYPLQILTWHEIVNDEVGGVPVAVTFCPLCNTPFAFERPVVDGEVTTFGTSGKLYHSNLVMYDRATSSLWPQASGRAVMGALTGATLRRLPVQIVAWEDFRSAFPAGRVLSRDTGHDRPYGENPYVGYDDVESGPWLFEGEVDGRLAPIERVLGVEAGDEVVAFPYFRLRAGASDGHAAVNTSVGGRPVVVVWSAGTTSALDRASIAASEDVGSAAAFSRRLQGRTLRFRATRRGIVDASTGTRWNLFGRAVRGPLAGRRLHPMDAHDSFWFDWAAFHPDTALWGSDRPDEP